MARLIRGIKPDLQVLGQTDRTKRNAKVVAIFSQELDSILENISISDIKGACINPASIFADHLVRFGSHYDLKGGYANLSEAIKYYDAAVHLNPLDESLLDICFDALTNLRQFALTEGKSAEIIRDIEIEISYVEKARQDFPYNKKR